MSLLLGTPRTGGAQGGQSFVQFNHNSSAAISRAPEQQSFVQGGDKERLSKVHTDSYTLTLLFTVLHEVMEGLYDTLN